MARPLLGELLVSAKVITKETLEEALSARVPGRKLGQELLARGLITEAQLTQTLSLQLGVPWVSLYHIDFSRALLNRVPRELAEKHCLVPIFVRTVKGQGDTLYLATEDPKNEAGLAEVSKAAGLPTRPMIASPSDIKSAIRVYYGGEDLDADGTPPPNTAEASSPPTARADGAGTPSTSRDGKTRGIAPGTAVVPPVPPPPLPPQANGGPPSASASSPPSAAPSQPPGSGSQPPPRKSTIPPRPSDPDGVARMVALTLLDGTQIQLPARAKKRGTIPPSAGGISEALTARDLVSALRAVSHGADASEILGDEPQWEPILAALLSILLRKGLIADWEFIDEYRKI